MRVEQKKSSISSESADTGPFPHSLHLRLREECKRKGSTLEHSSGLFNTSFKIGVCIPDQEYTAVNKSERHRTKSKSLWHTRGLEPGDSLLSRSAGSASVGVHKTIFLK